MALEGTDVVRKESPLSSVLSVEGVGWVRPCGGQRTAGTRQCAVHGRGRAPEDRASLVRAEPQHLPQHKRRALLRGPVLQGGDERQPHGVPAGDIVGGIPPWVPPP